MRVFSDNVGVIIDPFGVGLSTQNTTQPEMRGIRISPRQSPNYQPHVIKIFTSCFLFYLK